MSYNIDTGLRSVKDIVLFVDAPVISEGAQATGGTLNTNTTYYYEITALDSQTGETKGSNQLTVSLTDSNQTSQLTWTNVSGATSYRGYRSLTGDLNSWEQYDDISNPWIDTNASSTASSAEPPNYTNAFIDRLSFNESSWLSVGDTIFKLSTTGVDVTGNMAVDGRVTSLQTGVGDSDDTVATKKYVDDVVANSSTSSIGLPTNGSYTTDILLNVTEDYSIADGFQGLDFWLRRNLIDTPPAPSLVSVANNTSSIYFSWLNPERVELGFVDVKVPQIDEIVLRYKTNASADVPGNWNTINTGSDTVQNAQFWVESLGSSGLSGSTWIQYAAVQSVVPYDFEVYGTNDNDINDLHKLKDGLRHHLTATIGEPNAPTSVSASSIGTTSLTLSWTKPTDHDLTTEGLQTSPFIGIYKIDIAPNTTTSYNGLHPDTRTLTTTYNGTSNSATSKAITSMMPGHTYDFLVYANNTQNSNGGPLSDGFSENSTLYQATTTEPSAPSSLSTSDCSALVNSATLRSPYNTASSTGAKNMDGTSLTAQSGINGLVTRFANLTDANLKTTTAANRRNNTVIATGAAVTGELVAFGGNTSDYQSQPNGSVNLKGFGQTTVNGTYSGASVELVVEDDNDNYSSPSDGFWKKFDAYVKANDVSANFRPQTASYSFRLSYDADGAAKIQTNPVTFYVDDLGTNPVINNPLITSVSNVTELISGVPTYKSGAVFDIQYNVENIARQFLRHDLKHADVVIKGNSTAYGSTLTMSQSDIGGTHKYYDEPGTPYNTASTLHNTSGLELQTNPGNIQFNTFTTSLTSASDNRFDEHVGIEVKGYNLYQNGGSAVTGYARDPSDNSNKGNIRLDTLSVTVVSNTGTASTVRGQHRKSDSHQSGFTGVIGDTFPNEANMTAYDHTDAYSLNDNDELILANGKFRSPSDTGNHYRDYSVFYFETISPVDYSSIGTSGKRYFSSYYTGLFATQDDFVTLKLVDQVGTWSGTTHSDIALNIKITGTSNSTDTVWMNCNAAIEGTGIGDSGSQTEGVTCLLLGGDSGNITSAIRKVCQLHAATTAGNLYVRLGIDGTSTKGLKWIEARKGKDAT